MAGTISESYVSRPFTVGRQSGRELVYDVRGTEDEEEVETLLAATAPAVYLGLELEGIQAEPLGGGVWKGHANYVRVESDDEYTFDTGGGTQKITQSLATIGSYAPTGLTAPDFQGAIGVSEDKVEGVDVPVPVYQWTETHRFDNAFVAAGYNIVLFNMTGRVNDATFKGFASGEVLFLGAAGGKRGDDLWSITFRFAASPNRTDIAVGPDIVVTEKYGWDYLWVRYSDFYDPTGLALVKRPIAAYVERVSLPGDFSLLSIGT